MQARIPKSLGSPNPDKELIKSYISANPFRGSSTSNLLFFYRTGVVVFGNSVGLSAQAPYGDIGIIDDTTVGLFGEMEDSLLDKGHMLWEDSDVEMVISGPTTLAHMDPLRAWFEDYILTRIQDRTEKITEYYEEQLAIYEEQLSIKESEIKALSSELSQIKEDNQRRSHEPEQIKSQYKEEIAKIPEVQQAMYIENVKELQFITVLSDLEKALSHEIYVIENELEKKYPNWSLDFQYIEPDEYPEEVMAKYFL